jgi:hypothetical protein
MVDLVHLLPFPLEGYKPYCTHVGDVCILEDKMILLSIVAKHPLLLNYHGCVICQGPKGIQLYSMKGKCWVYIQSI